MQYFEKCKPIPPPNLWWTNYPNFNYRTKELKGCSPHFQQPEGTAKNIVTSFERLLTPTPLYQWGISLLIWVQAKTIERSRTSHLTLQQPREVITISWGNVFWAVVLNYAFSSALKHSGLSQICVAFWHLVGRWRGGTKHPTIHRTAPHNKELFVPKCQ